MPKPSLKKLNYKFAPHDPRDYPYAHVMKLERREKLPEEVDLTKKPFYPPIYDQDSQGSCTGQAAVGVKDHITRRYVPNFRPSSRGGLYRSELEMNGSAGQDNGSDGRTSAQVLMIIGAGAEKLCPYTNTNYRHKLSAEYLADAALNKIDAFYVLKSEYDIMHCLAAGFPFVKGMYVPKQMMDDDFKGILPADLKPSDILIEDGEPAGHQVSCFGYKNINGVRYALMRNSWGTDWGDKGHFWMPMRLLLDPQWTDASITYRLAHEPGV
jgi:hypothetical protein